MEFPNDGRDKLDSYIDGLQTRPLILERSEEEKSVNANLLREQLFWVKGRRWLEGFIMGVGFSILVVAIIAFFVIGKK